ncbi:MAG: hypothetical protein ABW101_08060 [Candidatus Thiodiazotropha sp.]
MKRPSFSEGVGVSLLASLLGGALFPLLTLWLAGGFALRGLITLLGLFYLLYLLRRSARKPGRVVAVTLWLLISPLSALLGIGLWGDLLIHLALLWLVRCGLFHNRLYTALMDLGLVATGLAAALWGSSETGTLVVGLWSFFLVQALFVFIPHDAADPAGFATPPVGDSERFDRAYRAAQDALQRQSRHPNP